MNLNSTPSANRIHIGIFGKRNAGKSSVINAITNQDLAIVSGVKGTTTDPVYKAMELLPIGPVVLIDTPGLDDEGELGEQRVKKGLQVLNKVDVAIVVVSAEDKISNLERQIIKKCEDKNIPFIVAINKSDIGGTSELSSSLPSDWKVAQISAKTGSNIDKLKELIASSVKQSATKYPLVSDLISKSDIVVLVVPIDSAAPKGRLILPQQQVIRDILDSGAIVSVCQESELERTLNSLKQNPRLVITDSQVFEQVSKKTPADVPLTSFSILFARHKGILDVAMDGAHAVNDLKPGDKVLISEGCTHHRQCDDIGTVKLPRWISSHLGFESQFEFTSGLSFSEDLSSYKLVVHCGGCMLPPREVQHRFKSCKDAGVPITNYGILIAELKGILARSTEIFS